MPAVRTSRLLLAPLLFAALAALAQSEDYEPEMAQEGKDVIWVPTPEDLVERMLDAARVTPQDFVVDLGSGDGRVVIAAAKRGAHALGVEFDPGLVAFSRRRASEAGVSERARFVRQDFFEADFSHATVVALFLLPEINVRLRPKILALKPGTRVVANTYGMEPWKPDERAVLYTADGHCGWYCTVLLWYVPAQVAGRHAVPGGELELRQEFQMLAGTLHAGGAAYPAEGRVRGEEVEVSAGGRVFRGRASGGTLELR